MKITAAVKRPDNQKFVLDEVELDAPRADEILVKIAGVGICHTDLVMASGAIQLPAVLGHEGSGTVEAVGADVREVAVGDRVAISFRSCGDCDRCATGDAPYCRTMPMLNYTGRRTDGTTALHDEAGEISSNFFGQSSFATHALTYERNVVKVPDDVPLELVGPLGCGIQTGLGGVINSLAAPKGSTIMITGGGPVGLSAVMGAKIQGCSKIILLEPHAARREFALELGATHTLDPANLESLAVAVREIEPMGIDFAFDTTGIPDVLEGIMDCLGSKGTLGVVGIAPPDASLPGKMVQAMSFGHTVKGIVEGDSDPKTFIPQMLAYHREGRLPFDKMIKTYPMSQINEAIAEQHAGKCIKAVLIPD